MRGVSFLLDLKIKNEKRRKKYLLKNIIAKTIKFLIIKPLINLTGFYLIFFQILNHFSVQNLIFFFFCPYYLFLFIFFFLLTFLNEKREIEKR